MLSKFIIFQIEILIECLHGTKFLDADCTEMATQIIFLWVSWVSVYHTLTVYEMTATIALVPSG